MHGSLSPRCGTWSLMCQECSTCSKSACEVAWESGVSPEARQRQRWLLEEESRHRVALVSCCRVHGIWGCPRDLSVCTWDTRWQLKEWRTRTQGYWMCCCISVSKRKTRSICIEGQSGAVALGAHASRYQQLGRLGHAANWVPKFSSWEILIAQAYTFCTNRSSSWSAREGNRMRPLVLSALAEVLRASAAPLCVAGSCTCIDVSCIHCVLVWLLEICSQPQYWLDLGPWSCRNLAAIRLLDLIHLLYTNACITEPS